MAAGLIMFGCGQGKKAEQFTALPFPEVFPPGMMTEQDDIAAYIAGHCWDVITSTDRVYPCDSLLVSGVRRNDVEHHFADWVNVLNMVPLSMADKAVERLCDRAMACERKDTASNILETFTELARKYFYDPNSPMRDEDYYYSFVSKLASFEGLSPEIRGKYEFETRMCGLNRRGTVAADFRFADKKGKIRNLHDIDSPLILLFFSNPGCDACMNIIEMLKGEPRISGMIAEGELSVLNIYIDEDLQGWMDYMPIYPEEWYNGFDPDMVIRNNNLYNVRAIPSLYLLDHEKRVLMKDAPENRVFDFLVSR